MTRLIDADTPIHVQIYDDMTEEWRLKETTVATALDYWADEGCPPTVEAVPVVHGRWKSVSIDRYVCSVCGCEPWYGGSIRTLNYCPYCGADMRGEQDGWDET